MNKKQVSTFVVAALKVLEDGVLVHDGKIDSKMIGKMAAFGPTVLSMGIKPAVALYSRTSGGADRLPVVNAILAVLRECGCSFANANSLLDAVRNLEGSELRQAKTQILAASVALKLAMRTYPENKQNQ